VIVKIKWKKRRLEKQVEFERIAELIERVETEGTLSRKIRKELLRTKKLSYAKEGLVEEKFHTTSGFHHRHGVSHWKNV
jgi:hypothetical protein